MFYHQPNTRWSLSRGSYMNLIFFFFEGNFFTSSYQGCRCRFNFAQQQTQWISGKHCFLPHKFDSLLLVLCTDGFALTLYQVIDHTRSGETLVIGLVLRRYVITFVHQLQKELLLKICIILSFVYHAVICLFSFNLKWIFNIVLCLVIQAPDRSGKLKSHPLLFHSLLK